MRLTSAAYNRLRKTGISVDAVEDVLERIERSTPHLKFDLWSTDNDKSGESTLLGSSHYPYGKEKGPLHLHISINGTIITVAVHSDFGVGHIDKRFLEFLADEAAHWLEASKNAPGAATDFGLRSVAQYLQSRYLGDGQGVERALNYLRQLSSLTYENQRIPYGIVLRSIKNSVEEDPAESPLRIDRCKSKRLRRFSDGVHTAIELDQHGQVQGLMQLAQTEGKHRRRLLPRWLQRLSITAEAYAGIGIALTRGGDIVIVDGSQLLFAFRSGRWQSWRPELLTKATAALYKKEGQPANISKVIAAILDAAVDISFARTGGLLVVAHSVTKASEVIASARDRIGSPQRLSEDRQIDITTDVPVFKMGRDLLVELSSLDGAVVVDRKGVLHGYGALVRSSKSKTQGSRSRAAEGASRYGVAIKISSDGGIDMYVDGRKGLSLGG